ncbi:MAG: CoA ester lyase [Rhodobiaceae bacterium]|nr:CoA ester lyase [Rhodobiaceae bacterium]MCC0060409.1 CoA ester lyase [Rhodobiaceae bacterium]
MRPIHLCRSWLFVGGPQAVVETASLSKADAVILELEDFTPPEKRPEARKNAPHLFEAWRAADAIAAVRINPLWEDGADDLAAVMEGRPDIVMLPKVRGAQDILALAEAVAAHEKRLGMKPGEVRIVPNIESAAALFLTRDIAQAHPRVVACLMASEDMTADLGAPRSREGTELAFARAHFHAACTAAGMISIDYPYTFSDIDGLQRNCAEARALGYKAKSLVAPEHGAAVNAAFTPSHEECLEAARIVEAFEAARKRGEDRAHLDGHLVEVPTYRNALAVIARAAELDRFA